MSVTTVEPIPGVTYYRSGAGSWTAKDRPSLTAVTREALVPGTYLPDATNTGLLDPNVIFRTENNAVTYDSFWSGQVIENVIFMNKVSVTGPNITFKNCYFRGPAVNTGEGSIVACTAAGVSAAVFQDCEFSPRAPNSGTNCINGHHFTLLRCNLHRSVDGVGIIPRIGGRADVFIIGTWIHDLAFFSPDPFQNNNATHNDCIQWHGGLGLTILGSRLEGFYDPAFSAASQPPVEDANGDHLSGNPYYPSMNATSCLLCNTHIANTPPGQLSIRKTYINGGGSALVFSSAPAMTNVGEVVDNFFGRNYRNGADFAILANTGATQPLQTFTLTGNVRWDDGTPFNVRKKGD